MGGPLLAGRSLAPVDDSAGSRPSQRTVKVPQNFIDRAEGAAVCRYDGLHGFVSLRATEVPDSVRDKSRVLPGHLWMGAAHQTLIPILFLILNA